MLTVRHSNETSRIEELPLDAVPDLLRSGKTPLWFDLDSPTQAELDFLETKLRIHHLTLEDIVKQNQRPKIESFEDYIYLVIHPLLRKNGLEIEPAEVDLLLGRHWLVMVHYGPIPGLVEDSQFNERLGLGLNRGADYLLYTIVDLIVDSCFPLLDQIDDEIDALEDRLLGQADIEDMNRLLILKRSLVHIRRAVGPQREVFNQLTRRDFPFVRPEYTVYFRDVYDHLIRITEELDSLRDILSGALEVHLSSISNQLNVTMKRLSAWGTIFVIITAIAGIYGMNFEYMPELKWRYGYHAIMTLMTAISVGLYFYFKRKDYF
ncbi:MAG: magnesium/cobalt transporter CorA [Deltaproteobacteria bacterium]|nr:magnesium/cobalt transporter CorA [Deltaproteobacteria bacterium]